MGKEAGASSEGRFTVGVVPVGWGRAGRDRSSPSAGNQVSAWREVGVTTRIVLGLRARLRGRWSAVSFAWRGSWRTVVRSVAVLAVGIAATWTVLVTVGAWVAALVGAGAFVVWLAASRRRVIPASAQSDPVQSRARTSSLGPEMYARSRSASREWSRRNL